MIFENLPALQIVIKKINHHMEINGLNLRTLAMQLPELQYQSLYRLVKQGYNVNIGTLITISEYFDCTVSELLSDKMILKTKCYKTINDYANKTENYTFIKISLPIEIYENLNTKIYFAISTKLNELALSYFCNNVRINVKTDYIQFFIDATVIDEEAFYIANINGQTKTVMVDDIKSNIVAIDDDFVRLPDNSVILAKHIMPIHIYDTNTEIVSAWKLPINKLVQD